MPTVESILHDHSNESEARRLARRVGLRVHTSRARLSLNNLGEFMLIDARHNWVVGGARYDWTAEDIIAYCEERLKQ